MIRFDLTTLRIFVAVYNLKSLTKAAEQEHIASSAVSKRINDLETELDVQLFYRHPRGVSATPAGEALAAHARSLFESVNEMAADLSTYAGGTRGQVRIHAHSSAMHQFLPCEIASFTRLYPEVRVVLREETTPNVIQSMQDGIADIGVVAGHIPLPSGLTAIAWREDQLIALLPASDPLAASASLRFRALAERSFISLETGSSLQILLSEAAEAQGLTIDPVLEVTTFGSAIEMAAAGLGFAIMPQGVVPDDPRVVSVPLDDEWAHRTLSICMRSSGRLNASVRLMLRHLRGETEAYRREKLPLPNE
ncbi:LysR family transcriptional regulator [Acuticoccus sediminis]|uniref:LysR family transcriptional regulator n=1 Tax=Acuticoccus sediminis TaxID=2184697 RepID=UPI001CFDB5F5|nr:LysR family transcriptional regulator [Acuticoccus sediminis]